MLILRATRQFRPQLLAALALALFLAPATAQAGNLYMVSVGVTNAIGHPHLTATAKDARDMAAWAKSQKGKLFQQVYVTTLTDNNATVKNVVANLNWVKDNARAQDYVIFYDSSHGGDGGNGEYVMCVYDGNLLWSQVLGALKDSPATKIAILDTCESGMAANSSQPGYPIVFASSAANQSSLDGDTNSLYTKYLLQGLYGKADTNHDGYVSLVEATSYAGQMLQNYDKGKKAGDQQNSTWSRPTNINMHLPIAKLTPGYIGGNSGDVAGANDLMVYSGTENLKGYGKLAFHFQTGGKVIMHDAKSTIHGTWSKNGNQVTLSFTEVGATYHGTMSGFQIFGYGTDVKGQKWSFSVNRTN
jgi:hypothetical protein